MSVSQAQLDGLKSAFVNEPDEKLAISASDEMGSGFPVVATSEDGTLVVPRRAAICPVYRTE